MQDFATSFLEAFRLVVELDSGLLEIVWLSLKVSMTAAIIAAIIGWPIVMVLVRLAEWLARRKRAKV